MTADPLPSVVVAVGSAGDARELIAAGARLSRRLGATLHALHVDASPAKRPAGFEANEALALAAQSGASVARISATSVAEGLIAHLADRPAEIIVLGHRVRPYLASHLGRSLADKLRARLPDIGIYLVPSPAHPKVRILRTGERASAGIMLKAFGAVVLTTLLALALNRLFGIRSLSLLFLFPVIAAATRWGYVASLLAAILSALAFNFFFLDPAYVLRPAAPQTWFMGGVLGVIAVYTTTMTATLRSRALLSDRSASESAAIATFARRLAHVSDWSSTAATVCEQLAESFSLHAVLLRETEGKLHVEAAAPGPSELSPIDWTAIDWVWAQGEPAGSGTDMLPTINWQFQPLRTSLGMLAIVGIARDDGRDPIPPERKLLFDTLLAQAALAHERLRLMDTRLESGRCRLATGRSVDLAGVAPIDGDGSA